VTLDPESVAPVLAAAGSALLAFVLLRRLWRRSSSPPPATPSEARTDARGALDRYEVELHELAREVTARIDTKLALLEELIRQADARAAELRSLLKEAKVENAADERR
jgi:anti-sigma factor RsiW